MRICITGSFGNQDLGDDAMLEEHLRHLESWGYEREQIILYGHQPAYMAGYFDHPRKLCRSSSKTPNPAEYDCLIVTGGGTINHREGSNSLRRMHRLVMPFVQAGKPVFMSGQTIGPFKGPDASAKEIIEGVNVLTVRDSGWSRWFMRQIKAKPKELIETVDDAVGLLLVDIPERVSDFIHGGKPTSEINPYRRNPMVAMNVTRYTTDTDRKKKAFWSIANQLMGEGHRVLLIPHDSEDRRFLQTVAEGHTKCLYWQPERAGQIKKAVSLCNFAVGGRYHFGVFCMSIGTPVIMLTGSDYSYVKNIGLAEHYNQQYRVVDVEDSDEWSFLVDRMIDYYAGTVDGPRQTESFPRLEQWLEDLR